MDRDAHEGEATFAYAIAPRVWQLGYQAVGAEKLQEATALTALAATLARIVRGALAKVDSQVTAAETSQRMLTPQDGNEKLLIGAAERIESATFTPRQGGAAASTIQQVEADLGIGDHGQAVEVTTGGLV